LSTIWGFPPKVVWSRRGNCTTRDIEEMLRGHKEGIESLAVDPDTGVLMLFWAFAPLYDGNPIVSVVGSILEPIYEMAR
jgi:hypothetical protein